MKPNFLLTKVQKTASNKRHLELNADTSKNYIMSRDHSAGKYQNIILWNYDKFQLFGNDARKLKFRSWKKLIADWIQAMSPTILSRIFVFPFSTKKI